MSHFSLIAIIPSELTDGDALDHIARHMERYSENRRVALHRVPIVGEALARMVDAYQTTDKRILASHMPDWNGTLGGVQGDELYYESTYNPESKWDWYVVGGGWSGVIVGKEHDRQTYSADIWNMPYNRVSLSHLPQDIITDTYAILDPAGEWHAKGRMGWFGSSHDEDEHWRGKAAEILSGHRNGYDGVMLDCHI